MADDERAGGARRAGRRSLVCQVYVFGGSAMVLAFDGRGSTQDVDSRYTSTSVVDEVAAEVARRLSPDPPSTP